MKNYEERYTAWLDGNLPEPERARFEAELDDLDAACRDRADAARLGALLRASVRPARLAHADFLNSQVLTEIGRRVPGRMSARLWIGGSFSRARGLALAGGSCLAAALLITVVFLPRNEGRLDQASLISQVVSARAADPSLSASSFNAKVGRGSVIWVQGMEFVPEEAIKPIPEKASEPARIR